MKSYEEIGIVSGASDWDITLPQLVFLYNSMYHKVEEGLLSNPLCLKQLSSGLKGPWEMGSVLG